MSPTFLSFNIVEVGIFLAACGYVWTQWRQGGSKATKELVETYRAQMELNAIQLKDLSHELGVLKGEANEKDKRITLLEGLVKTTPEQAQFMDEMRKFSQGLAEYMANSTKTLGEVSVFMHNLNNK